MGGPKPISSRNSVAFAAFILFWMAVTAAILLVQHPDVLRGAQTDADGYLRLVRVRLLLEEWEWFNSVIPRSNWPFGESLHWTRPLDILILLLVAPLLAAFPPSTSLAIAGAIVGPLLHLALCLVGVWVVRPFAPGPERFLAMPALLVQLGILGYGNPGRADHHILLFLLVILALGWWVRAVLDPEDVRAGRAAGIISAAALWVSPEALLPLAVLLGSGAVLWFLEGGRMLQVNRRFSEGLLAGILIAVLVERPPSEYLVAEFDRISSGHLTMAVLIMAVWAFVGTLYRWVFRSFAAEGARWGRFWLGLSGGGAAFLLLVLIHPGFVHGPWAELHPDFPPALIASVPELQPLWPRDATGFAIFLMHMAPALFVAPFLARWVVGTGTPMGRVWVIMSLGFLVFFPLALAQIRLSAYLGIFSALGMVELARRALARIPARSPWQFKRAFLRVTVMAAILIGPLALGVGASVAISDGRSETDNQHGTCDLASLAPFLTDPKGLGAKPRTIAAAVAFGPELLYRTPHRVLAGPYHRNVEGVGDLFRLFNLEGEGEIRRMAERRELDLILLCPPRDQVMLSEAGERALHHRLLEGQQPEWIRPVVLPPGVSMGFQLFEIVSDR